jgi:MFS family permease
MNRTTTIWTFVITSVALFMATLDNLVVTTSLPVIRADLGASIEDLEWTVNAYTLSFAVFLLTGAAGGSSRSGSASSREPPWPPRSRPRWRR